MMLARHPDLVLKPMASEGVPLIVRTSYSGTGEEAMFVVIFEVHAAERKRNYYVAHAKALKPEVEAIDGFVDNERFENRLRPGWVLSLSTWRDEKSVIRWRTQSKHHFTQEKGRAKMFSDYRLRVAEVTTDTHPPLPIRQMRFDTTESGGSKAGSVLEFTPREGFDAPLDMNALTATPRSGRTAAEPNEFGMYDSIYNPGKALALVLWSSEDDAASVPLPTAQARAETRLRSLRIIRDYGMFDRRETPQFYPDKVRR
jgi:heme-degrading monooxygenase HmoA